jgi:hypothetical protein
MSVDVESFPRQATTGWWRLDPRVVAHLRARTGPLLDLWSVAPARARRSADADGDSPTAYAPTCWPDTEWSDTRSDFAP